MPPEAILNNIDDIIKRDYFTDIRSVISLVNSRFRLITGANDEINSLINSSCEKLANILFANYKVTNDIKIGVIKLLSDLANTNRDEKFTFSLDHCSFLMNSVKKESVFIKSVFRYLYNQSNISENSDNIPIFMMLFEAPEFKEEIKRNLYPIHTAKFTQKSQQFLEKNNIKINLRFLNLMSG
jgi:hypothetical protein